MRSNVSESDRVRFVTMIEYSGMTLKETWQYLDITQRCLSNYRSGSQKVPKVALLAMEYKLAMNKILRRQDLVEELSMNNLMINQVTDQR